MSGESILDLLMIVVSCVFVSFFSELVELGCLFFSFLMFKFLVVEGRGIFLGVRI